MYHRCRYSKLWTKHEDATKYVEMMSYFPRFIHILYSPPYLITLCLPGALWGQTFPIKKVKFCKNNRAATTNPKRSSEATVASYTSFEIHTRERDSLKAFPTGTWRKNDVILTTMRRNSSMRRNYVASTSKRRHFGTKCPLGSLWGRNEFILSLRTSSIKSDNQILLMSVYYIICD